jgi:signal transduction histidine kinase
VTPLSRSWRLRGGETGRLIADRDWSTTSLGAINTWSPSLNTALAFLLMSPVPMVMLWGPDGIMLYNDAYSAFAGGRHPGILGSKVREGWPEAADFNDHVMKVGLAGGTLAFRNHELTLWRNGVPEQVRMNLDYSPVFDESGEPAGVFAIVVETTDAHRAEQDLLSERQALDRLNRLAGEIGSMQDRGAIVQQVVDTGVSLTGAAFGAFFTNVHNEAGESYMLYTLSGAPYAAFAAFPMPRNTAVFAPTFSGEGVVRSEDVTQDLRYGHNTPHRGMPEGHLPVTSYLAVPVIARNRSVIGGILFGHPEPGRFTLKHEAQAVALAAHAAIAIENADLIRDVREANETLEQRVEQRTAELTEAHEALRQAQKMEAVGQLTGGIAHDFNNLLAGISGSLELIERRLAEGRSSGLERFIAGAQSSAKRASALTQRLLAFSRRQTLDPKPIDTNRLIHGIEDLIRRTIGPAITLEVVGAGGLWTTRVDPAQLESALINLAINARDAMPDGGRITIETANKWLDARAAPERDLAPGQYISICVTDTGTGIAKDVIDRIFDPFFTTKPIGKGTGLGLSMVHGFVRQSGGQVRVYSETGQVQGAHCNGPRGTTMCLYLPRHHGPAFEEISSPGPIVEAQGNGRIVLVIDDEPMVRMLILEVLEEAGFRSLEAEDGPGGLRLLELEPGIALLITDVGLPGGMNGRQVADAARQNRPELKVLFVTGYAENAAVGNGLLDPGMEIITKPFGMTELAAKITEMIDG